MRLAKELAALNGISVAEAMEHIEEAQRAPIGNVVCNKVEIAESAGWIRANMHVAVLHDHLTSAPVLRIWINDYQPEPMGEYDDEACEERTSYVYASLVTLSPRVAWKSAFRIARSLLANGSVSIAPLSGKAQRAVTPCEIHLS